MFGIMLSVLMCIVFTGALRFSGIKRTLPLNRDAFKKHVPFPDCDLSIINRLKYLHRFSSSRFYMSNDDGTSQQMEVSSNDHSQKFPMILDVPPTPFTLSCLEGLSCASNLNITQWGIMSYDPISSSQQLLLEWDGGLRRIFLLSKQDDQILPNILAAVQYLWNKGIEVLVEKHIFDSIVQTTGCTNVNNGLLGVFDTSAGRCGIDLVITFGGDGLLMYCNSLFEDDNPVPPILSFDFGSLGFLAPFLYEDFETIIDSILLTPMMITLRMRLECTIYRHGNPNPASVHHVLNEAVIDRGTAPFLSVVDITCNNHYLTTIQGDGVIVATPTGSTAYSLAAGGSMVHPSVPAILITPVCAHTLSIRPLILPETSVLRLSVPFDCRANGWVSFDGKFRQELQKGDYILVKSSKAPLPTVTKENFTGDWFKGLQENFYYNKRARQGA